MNSTTIRYLLITTLWNDPHDISSGFGTYKVGVIPASASSAVASGGPKSVERTASGKLVS